MICNSTPLICLAKLDKLEFLKKLFKIVIIPKEVKEEVIIEGKPGYLVLLDALKKEWIKVKNPKEKKDFGLGKGENSAISLAIEKKDSLILDDATAIKVAKAFNVEYVRTTSVILMALKKRIIKKKEAINLIQELIKEGYYISPGIYIELIQLIEKSRT